MKKGRKTGKRDSLGGVSSVTFLYVTGMERLDEEVFREVEESGLPVKVEIVKEKLEDRLQRAYLRRLGRIYRKACFLDKGVELWTVAVQLRVEIENREAGRIIVGDVQRMLAERGISTVVADGCEDAIEMARRWSFVVMQG